MAATPDHWPARAARLAGLIPSPRLHRAVLKFAASRPARGPWVVALSGGADSVALLLLLWAHWPERRARLQAVHFNHRLRGRAADGDEAFCRELCRGLGVKLAVGRRRATQALPSEAAARAARFASIDHVMTRRRAKCLWLGHQRDDVAETMFMRLARGSGTGGLAAPRPVQPMPDGRRHLRPLLDLCHGEIIQALRAARAPWREDRTNQTGNFFRNRIRRDVLPAWQAAAGRDALAGAALARELLEEDDTALQIWADRLGARMPQGRLDLKLLDGAPPGVVRRLLHGWLGRQPLAGELSRAAFENLLAAVMQGDDTRQSLGARVFAVVRRGQLRSEKRRPG